MKLEWQKFDVKAWREYLLRVPQTNYLQSVPFSKAVLTSDHMTTRIAVLKKDETELGFLAINEIKLGPIHVVYLYRGPLWFQENLILEKDCIFAS